MTLSSPKRKKLRLEKFTTQIKINCLCISISLAFIKNKGQCNLFTANVYVCFGGNLEK